MYILKDSLNGLGEKSDNWISTFYWLYFLPFRYFLPVLRIYLTLMRIRILDPRWKKMDPDPGHFFKIY